MLRNCSQTVVLMGLSISRTKVLLFVGRENDGRVWVMPDYKLSAMLRNIAVPMTEERIMCKCEPQVKESNSCNSSLQWLHPMVWGTSLVI